MPTYSIDPLYPHWFRCDLCGKDVAEVLPAEAVGMAREFIQINRTVQER
jgi:hypothetical protein